MALVEEGFRTLPERYLGAPAGFDVTVRHTSEFRAQGDTLIYLLDGQEMARVKDARRSTGGGYLVAVKMMDSNPVLYESNTYQFLQLNDIWSGLIKAAVFGLILTLTGCVRGYYTRGGAEGVGRSTTNAVVSSSLIILFTDFFLTKILF